MSTGIPVQPRSGTGLSAATLSLLLAVALLVVSGLAHRLVKNHLTKAHLAKVESRVTLPYGTLDQLPMHIGDWVGYEVPLRKDIVDITGTDDHVSRAYTKREGLDVISLFIGYGARFRNTLSHSPEVCYPSAGWVLDESRELDLKAANGSHLPCRMLRFKRGELDPQRTTVLSYYVVDGKFYPDVSLLRSKVWRFETDVGYVARIQISASGHLLDRRNEGNVLAFAADSASAIQSLFREAMDNAGHDQRIR